MAENKTVKETVLDELQLEFCQKVNPDELLSYFLQRKKLTESDGETIKAWITRQDRALELIKIIKRKDVTLEDLTEALQASNHSFADQLLSTYQQILNNLPSKYENFISDLKTFYKTFGHIRVIKNLPDKVVPIKSIYVNTNLSLNGQVDDDYKILLNQSKTGGFPVICQGDPGCGKTTLLKKICYDWAEGNLLQYDVVLFCGLREAPQAVSFVELCLKWLKRHRFIAKHLLASGETIIKRILSTDREKVLINLLDALDEVDQAALKCDIIQDMFQQEVVVMDNPCIVTARIYTAQRIVCNIFSCIMCPLTQIQQETFIEKYFKVQAMPTGGEQLVLCLRSSPEMQNTMSTPLLLQMACTVTQMGHGNMNARKQTTLYEAMCLALLGNYREKHPDAHHNLPALFGHTWREAELVQNLGKLAFEMLLEEKYNFHEEDMQTAQIDPCVVEIGFMNVKTEEYDIEVIYPGSFSPSIYSFPHLTFQEFFAAVYINRQKDLTFLIGNFGTSWSTRHEQFEMILLFLLGFKAMSELSTAAIVDMLPQVNQIGKISSIGKVSKLSSEYVRKLLNECSDSIKYILTKKYLGILVEQDHTELFCSSVAFLMYAEAIDLISSSTPNLENGVFSISNIIYWCNSRISAGNIGYAMEVLKQSRAKLLCYSGDMSGLQNFAASLNSVTGNLLAVRITPVGLPDESGSCMPASIDWPCLKQIESVFFAESVPYSSPTILGLLEKLGNLKLLWLDGHGNAIDFGWLQLVKPIPAPNLRLTNCRIMDLNLNQLCCWLETEAGLLTSLVIKNCAIEVHMAIQIVKALQHQTCMSSLTFIGNKFGENQQKFSELCQEIKKIPAIREVNFTLSGLTDVNALALRELYLGLPSPKSFTMDFNKLTEECQKGITQLQIVQEDLDLD